MTSEQLMALAAEWRTRAEEIWQRKGKDYPAQSRAVEATFKQLASELEAAATGGTYDKTSIKLAKEAK